MFILISLVIVTLLGGFVSFEMDREHFFWLSFLTALALMMIAVFMKPLLMANLLRASKQTTSRLIDTASRELLWWALPMGCFLVSLAFFTLAYTHPFSPFVNFAIWLVLMGGVLDGFSLLFCKMTTFLDPYRFADVLMSKGIQRGRAKDLAGVCDAADALTEMALKAVSSYRLGLCETVLKKIEQLGIEEWQRLAIEKGQVEGQEEHLAQTNYIAVFFLQRLDAVFTQALEKGVEPLLNRLIIIASRFSLHLAKYDFTLATLPLHFVGKFTAEARRKELMEVSIQSSIALIELARSASTTPYVMMAKISPLYLSLIKHLEENAKATFKKDKRTSMDILTQPFKELKGIFETEPLQNHANTPIIIAEIDRVLAQFQELEKILMTLPEIPGLTPKVESSSATDKG